MKKLLNSLLLIFSLVSFSACKSDLDSLEDGNHRSQRIKNKPTLKTVRMSFGGDFITELEEPLLRAGEVDLFAGINVWRTEKKEGAKEEKYAYGLFKKENGIEIDLVTGYTYRFEATILIENEDKLYYNGGYLEPFIIKDSKANTGQDFKDELDVFQYTYNKIKQGTLQANDDRNYLHQLSSGTANVICKEFSPHIDLSYPRVKRFYGTISDIDPELKQSIEISMNYKCFGLKFVVEQLPSGYLTVEDITKKNTIAEKEKNEKLVFPTNFRMGLEERTDENYFKDVWEGMFSMNNLNVDKETIRLEFKWHKYEGDNNPKSFKCDLGAVPGVKKTLKINVSGTPNYEQEGNLILKMSDDILTEESFILRHDADINSTVVEKNDNN